MLKLKVGSCQRFIRFWLDTRYHSISVDLPNLWTASVGNSWVSLSLGMLTSQRPEVNEAVLVWTMCTAILITWFSVGQRVSQQHNHQKRGHSPLFLFPNFLCSVAWGITMRDRASTYVTEKWGSYVCCHSLSWDCPVQCSNLNQISCPAKAKSATPSWWY